MFVLFFFVFFFVSSFSPRPRVPATILEHNPGLTCPPHCVRTVASRRAVPRGAQAVKGQRDDPTGYLVDAERALKIGLIDAIFRATSETASGGVTVVASDRPSDEEPTLGGEWSS